MKTNVFLKPLLVVPAIPKNDGIKFILPKQDVTLDADITEKAWSILELCNGLNTIDEIIEQLKDQDGAFVTGFLNDLNTLGVVIDSRKFYKMFHTISNNPAFYQSDITSDEITEHVKSPRLSIKEGSIFKFHQNTGSALYRLQNLRTSCRSFSDESLSIDEIGNVLDIGYSLIRHAVPSAGNLYPMKVFAIALKDQKGFPAGYYEYDNEKNHLILFNESPDDQKILHALNDISMPFNAPVIFIIAADSDRQPTKYSNRGYRFMMIEAGEIAQNISLAAVEAGLATCELGGILDDVICEELRIDGCMHFLAIAIGKESTTKRENICQIADEYEIKFIHHDKSVKSAWLIDDTLENNYGKTYFQFLAMSKSGQITSGISTSWADAKLKAIAEAHERQCSSDIKWDIKARASDLKIAWLDPRIIAPLSDNQYRNLEHLQKFNEELEIEWVKGVRHNGEPIYVPIDLIFYPIENIGRKLIVDTCSSGFAAYTNYQEATHRGLLEIIERDSLMRSWFNKSIPNILSRDCLPTHIRNRVDFWSKRDKDVYFLDISQNGVIVIEVIIVSKKYPCFVSGASSSICDFNNTAIKAFQEAESRLIFRLNSVKPEAIKPENVKNIVDHEFLYTQSQEFHDHINFLWSGKTVTETPIATAEYPEIMEKRMSRSSTFLH